MRLPSSDTRFTIIDFSFNTLTNIRNYLSFVKLFGIFFKKNSFLSNFFLDKHGKVYIIGVGLGVA